MSTLDEELKNEIIQKYLEADPTPETSMDIVNDIAEEMDRSPNSIRMILAQAQVYIKKTGTSKSSTTGSSDPGEPKTRKSKQSSIDELTAAIKAAGAAVDDAILSKLTGKAAEYFNGVIKSLNK